MDTHDSTPSLTASRSPTPEPPVQPDHFYSLNEQDAPAPPSPDSLGRSVYDPDDDPFATRGIPVFRPSMTEFADFEHYMMRIEPWGMTSGIVKVIPPKEWTDALPSLGPQLANVKMKNPIEQHMMGRSGLYRQQNIMKNRHMSVREWAELCAKEDLRAPSVDELGLKAAPGVVDRRRKTKPKAAKEDTPVVTKEEEDVKLEVDIEMNEAALPTPPESAHDPHADDAHDHEDEDIVPADLQITVADNEPPIPGTENAIAPSPTPTHTTESPHKRKRKGATRAERDAALAKRADQDEEFMKTFDPHSHWLPFNTKADSYTPEVCAKLERRYWRNLGLGRPAWYGADMEGSLFTDKTKAWNVANLHSTLSRLLPASSGGLPGVNTPYLYFGMWRATFAWHVEDMDLFSINYIHFGAGKFWYAVPQAKAVQLENTMRSYFPKDTSACPQFLRHKSFLASPTLLSQSYCRPNVLVQHAGEFVITYPRGYHAGFNLGFNCAESVNFALDSWLDLGRKAQACRCIGDSVRIDVDQLLQDREAERLALEKKKSKSGSRKRKNDDSPSKSSKRPKPTDPSTDPSHPSTSSPRITLKLPSRPRKPAEPEPFPCCLCISMSKEGLLRVHETSRPGVRSGCMNIVERDKETGEEMWMAHEECAKIVPETWVDEVDIDDPLADDVEGEKKKERVVFGIDGIVKDRWNLKCSACTKLRPKSHGAPIQCTKGKCSKAFHISCAKNGTESGVYFGVLGEVEKQVVIYDYDVPNPSAIGAGEGSKDEMERMVEAHERWIREEEDEATAMSDEKLVDTKVDTKFEGMRVEGVMASLAPASSTPAASAQSMPSIDGVLPLDPSASMQANAQTLPTPIEPSDVSTSAPTQPLADATNGPTPKVIKTIKKIEMEMLCPQHNPQLAAQKKAAKMEKVRTELLALPPMSRIKLRVSAGVFEVSLVRVIEERQSVEVLWDGGVRKEFKWGSLVWGNMEGMSVGQKPSVPAPEGTVPPPNPKPSNIIRIKWPPNNARTYDTKALPIYPPASHTGSSSSSSYPPPGTFGYGAKPYNLYQQNMFKPYSYPGIQHQAQQYPTQPSQQQSQYHPHQYPYYPTGYATPPAGYPPAPIPAPPVRPTSSATARSSTPGSGGALTPLAGPGIPAASTSSTTSAAGAAASTYAQYTYGANGYRYPGVQVGSYSVVPGTSYRHYLPQTNTASTAGAVEAGKATSSVASSSSATPAPSATSLPAFSNLLSSYPPPSNPSSSTNNETGVNPLLPPNRDMNWIVREIQSIASLNGKELQEALIARPDIVEITKTLVKQRDDMVMKGLIPPPPSASASAASSGPGANLNGTSTSNTTISATAATSGDTTNESTKTDITSV